MEGKIKSTIRWDSDVYEQLQAESEASGVPIAELANRIIRQHYLGSNSVESRLANIESRLSILEARAQT